MGPHFRMPGPDGPERPGFAGGRAEGPWPVGDEAADRDETSAELAVWDGTGRDIAGDWEPNRARRLRIRMLVLAVLLAGAWVSVLRVPEVLALVALLVGGLLAALALLLAGMGLGCLGFGLFAAFDRVTAWFVDLAHWPGSGDEP